MSKKVESIKNKLDNLKENIKSNQQNTNMSVEAALKGCDYYVKETQAVSQQEEEVEDRVAELLIKELNKIVIDNNWLIKEVLNQLELYLYNKELDFEKMIEILLEYINNESQPSD